MKVSAIVAAVAWLNLLALTWAIMLGIVERGALPGWVIFISLVVAIVATASADTRKSMREGKENAR